LNKNVVNASAEGAEYDSQGHASAEGAEYDSPRHASAEGAEYDSPRHAPKARNMTARGKRRTK